MNQWVLTRAAVMGGLVLVACGPKTSDESDATASDLAALAEGNVERALRGTLTAGGFIADSATLANSFGMLGGSAEEDAVSVEDLRQSRDDMNESIDSVVKSLREKVFTKDNLETEGAGSATYLLGPKTLCASSTDTLTPTQPTPSPSPSPSAPTPKPTAEPALDPDCVAQANRLQIRLRLRSAGAGNVDVALLLTADQRNPATLELYSDHVGVSVNLGEIKATLDAIGEDTGSLVSLVGKLDFELRRNAERDYSFLGSVLEDVTIGVKDELGETAHVGVGKSVPTYELRLDGNARKVTGTLDVGAITVDGPLNAFRDVFDPEEYDELDNPVPRPLYQGAVEGLLAGIEAGVTLDGMTDKLTLNHLGLGDQTSTLKVDQNVIAALDLNPSAGRHFDLTVEKQGSGTLATFSPTLDVTVLMKLAPLAAQIADISPALLDNTLHFWFEGQNPSVQTGNDQLRVVSGTLHYSDAHDPTQDVTAAAGSCLASGDGDSSSVLAVTTCK